MKWVTIQDKLVKDIRKDVSYFYKEGKMVCCKTADSFEIDNQHLLNNYDIDYLVNYLVNNGFIYSDVMRKIKAENKKGEQL